MDLYRKKRMEKSRKHRKKSSEIYSNKDSSAEKVRANKVRPSINRAKYGSQPNLKMEDVSKVGDDRKVVEDSLKKLNQRAQFKSPKMREVASIANLHYEDGPSYSSLNQSKSHKYLSPNAFKKKNFSKMSSRYQKRKNSQIGPHHTNDSVFERLYREKEDKRLKMETLKEEYTIQESNSKRRSLNHSRSKSKSQSKKKRKPSKSPDEFYQKQMRMKVESEKLVLRMHEKVKNLESEIKANRKASKERRRRNDLFLSDKQNTNVHERLFQDFKDRSRKRNGFDKETENRNYESVGNLSISSLSRGDFRKAPLHQKVNESLHIPHINKKSRKIVTPKRDKSTSINTTLYRDAEVRRERQKEEKRRSKSREKEKISKQKKGTSKTSKTMLVKRYLIEFDNVAQKLGVSEEPESSIHYTQYIMLMQQLGFVSDQVDNNDDKLKMIWRIVQDQNNNDSGYY